MSWARKHVVDPLWLAMRNFNEDDGSMLSASMAYYAALSVLPMLLVLMAALGFVLRFSGEGQHAQRRLLEFVGEQTSPEVAAQVESMLDEVQVKATLTAPVGLITLTLAGIAIFAQLERGFDRIWKVGSAKARGPITVVLDVILYRLKAFLMLMVVGVMIVASFVAGLVLSGIMVYASEHVPLWAGAGRMAQFAISLLLNWLLFTLLYKYLPKVGIPWRAAAAGGLLAAVAWEIGRQALAAIVISDRYSAYGIIGSFIALMLWVYFGSAIVFFCAEFVKALTSSTRSGSSAR